MAVRTTSRRPVSEQSIGGIFAEEAARALGGGTKPLVQYQKNPIGFLVDVLGFKHEQIAWDENPGYENHTWDGDRNPLVKMCEGLADWKDVGVEAATGTQKSYTAAGLILWFLGSWEDSAVFTFAAKEDQLKNFIWMEMSKMWPRFKLFFPEAELTELRIRIIPGSDRWGAVGYSVGVGAEEEIATKAQGMHREHMLLVYEEMPGISTAITEAGENTCTAEHNNRLGLGNPNHQLDPLHKFCLEKSTVHVRISALDHPNVVSDNSQIVPGAVGRASIERRTAKYGVDSPKYLSRIRGISPEDSTDALFRKSLVDQAVTRWYDAMKARGASDSTETRVRALGVDVARSENGDRAAIAYFLGPVCEKVEKRRCTDVAKFGRDIYAEMIRLGVSPEHVGVDPIGVGSGTVDTLHGLTDKAGAGGLSMRVRELNGALTKWRGVLKGPDGGDLEYVGTSAEFGNLRAAMYCQAAADVQYGSIAVPDDDELMEELLEIRSEERNGKTFIEAKDSIIERLGRSPDKSDAFVYGNWVRPRVKKAPKAEVPCGDRAPMWNYERQRLDTRGALARDQEFRETPRRWANRPRYQAPRPRR